MIRLSFLRPFAAVGAAMIVVGASPALACEVSVEPLAGLSATYDPLQSRAFEQAFDVSFRHSCNPAGIDPNAGGADRPIDVEAWFDERRDAPRPLSLGALAYDVRADGRSVLVAFDAPPVEVATVRVSSAGVRKPFRLLLPPGQSGPGGERTLVLRWRWFDGTAMRSATQAFPVAASVAPVAAITTSGGGGSEVLDFGTLAAGMVQQTALVALATGPFDVRVDSVGGGHLRRTTDCATPSPAAMSDAERVAYSIEIDGSRILPGQAGATFEATEGSLARRPLTLRVAIDPTLQVNRKRAGAYCDVLTVRVAPR